MSNSTDMYFAVFDGTTQHSIVAENVIIEGVVSKWTVNVDDTGYMRMWRNDELVAEGQGVVPNDVDRGSILVGRSNWAADDDLIGEVRLLEIVNNGDAPEYVHLGLPTASLSGPSSVLEGDTGDAIELVYTVTLSAPAQNVVTADIVIAGDATGPAQVVIPTGEQSASFTVNATGDDIFEIAETVTVSLENLSQARATSLLSVVTDIQNDDFAQAPRPLLAEYFNLPGALSSLAQVNFDATPDFSELVSEINQYAGGGAFYSGGPTNYFATRYTGEFRTDIGGAYTFYLNSDDGSRLFVDGVEVIANDGLHAPVELSTTVNLTAGVHSIEVRYFENGGGAVVDLDWAGPSLPRQQMTFENTPYPVLSVSAPADAPEGDEGETGSLVFTVSLSNASSYDVHADVSISGGATGPATVTIPAGQTSAAISLSFDGDAVEEPDEQVSVTLSNVKNADPGTLTASALILDDDEPAPIPVLSITSLGDALEGDAGQVGQLTFNVTLDVASANAVTADVSILGGATGPATVTIPAGETSGTLTLNFAGDAVDEPDEQVTVTLSNLQNANAGTLSATSTILDDDAPAPPASRLQIGSEFVEQTNSNTWFSVSFDAPIENAIVVMGPITMNGGQPAMARVRNVTEDGFEWQIDEWDYLDGFHLAETVSWMAMSEGTYQLSDGRTISAGQTSLQNEAWGNVGLSGFSDTPVVFAQVASDADDAAVVTRIRNVDAGGFDIQMQEEEAADGVHALERVDYIAIEEGNGPGLRVGTTGDVVRHTKTTIDMSDDEFVFFANMQSRDGGDASNVRYYLGETSVNVYIDEEQSRDSEVRHTT